ncbi:MAG TPA: dTDP-4-dehydrorhamnose reductase [Anaerolineales bacterium]|jgi:dTDP-4-dehydrorhamnose reductase|nr:dTDP-4-dehydrorhamnose reductase [Anaerolineales bacterium]
MKILLFGAMGQLGTELQRTLSQHGELFPFDIHNLNLENTAAVRETIHGVSPEVIVNASAYTLVDQAESEAEKAFMVNGNIPGLFADEAAKLNAFLVHYSTDYVFDGSKGALYLEGDQTNPLGVYGKSKLAGEEAVRAGKASYLILRTSWVYSRNRNSFVTKVLEWARKQETLRIVSDQVSNPTWARTLADVTAQLLGKGLDSLVEHCGLYHVAGDGYASRLEWARKILELDPNKQEHKVKELLPALTSDFPTPAQRPLFSALDCSLFQSTFDIALPKWEDALALAMAE